MFGCNRSVEVLCVFLCGFSVSGLAGNIEATVESAVVGVEAGRVLAFPVLSFPVVPHQLHDVNDIDVYSDDFRCLSEKISTGDGIWHCLVSTSFVSKAFHMHQIPSHWVDSDGGLHGVKGGVAFTNGVGSGVAFDLGEHHEGGVSVVGRALLSDPSGFPRKTKLPKSIWGKWPELLTELNQWARAWKVKCGSNKRCVDAVNKISDPNGLMGDAYEYLLTDGRKVQYLAAVANLPGDSVIGGVSNLYMQESVVLQGDSLKASLWRVIEKDGRVSAPRLSPEKETYGHFSGVYLVDKGCESQCEGGWSGVPDILFVSNRVFAYGAFWRGTLSGYMFIEVHPKELDILGEYSWGS